MSNLLAPRYKVALTYPNSPFAVGCILEVEGDNCVRTTDNRVFHDRDVEAYPHIFEPLPWYAEMDIKDMPEYVRVVDPPAAWELPDNSTRRVSQWKFNDNNNLICDIFPVIIKGDNLNKVVPATLSEYETFINSKP